MAPELLSLSFAYSVPSKQSTSIVVNGTPSGEPHAVTPIDWKQVSNRNESLSLLPT